MCQENGGAKGGWGDRAGLDS